MNTDTYEQIAITEEGVGDAKYYLAEGMQVSVSIFEEKPIGIDLPKTVVMTIDDTQPEIKGGTASNSPKPATTNTGLTITVPAFLKIGDRVTVDTDTGNYLSRADQ